MYKCICLTQWTLLQASPWECLSRAESQMMLGLSAFTVTSVSKLWHRNNEYKEKWCWLFPVCHKYCVWNRHVNKAISTTRTFWSLSVSSIADLWLWVLEGKQLNWNHESLGMCERYYAESYASALHSKALPITLNPGWKSYCSSAFTQSDITLLIIWWWYQISN